MTNQHHAKTVKLLQKNHSIDNREQSLFHRDFFKGHALLENTIPSNVYVTTYFFYTEQCSGAPAQGTSTRYVWVCASTTEVGGECSKQRSSMDTREDWEA